MTQLITVWSTDDQDGPVGELLRLINDLPEHSPDKLEAMAGLHVLQAKWNTERAAIMRHDAKVDQRRKERAAATRAANKAAAGKG